MRTRDVMFACGMVCSMFMAGVATAQQDQPRPTAEKPAANQPANRPENVDRKPLTTTTKATTTTNADQPSLLRELEGVWRVEVTCNESFWKMSGKSKGDHAAPAMDVAAKPAVTPPPRDSDNEPAKDRQPEPTRNDPNRPTDPNRVNDTNKPVDPNSPPPLPKPGEPRDPNRDANRDLNRDATRDTTRSTDPTRQPGDMAAKSFSGYAETRLVLGNNILQQSIVIPDMPGAGAHKTPGDIRTTPSAPTGASGEMFRGMSFLAFDADSQQYSIVFMDSRNGKIHCDHGTYDDSEKRIVFNGRSDNDHDNNQDMPKGKHGQNIRVVLEIVSPTEHRVTMYALGGTPSDLNPTRATPSAPNTNPDNTPGANQPPRNDPATDRNLDRNNDRNLDRNNDRNLDRTISSRDGTMIYQATYTKASGDDSSRFRRLIAEPGAPIPGDRDNR